VRNTLSVKVAVGICAPPRCPPTVINKLARREPVPPGMFPQVVSRAAAEESQVASAAAPGAGSMMSPGP